jgi:hypothetical protein
MAQLGDPELRPQETSAVAAANTTMEELERFSTQAVVACLCSDRDIVDPACIKKAFCSKLRVREDIRSCAMKTNGKTLFLFSFIYFLIETRAGLKNTCSKTESENTYIRKRTNTDKEPKN